MASWKTKFLSAFLALVIITICFSPLIPTPQAHALVNCIASQAEITTDTSAAGIDASTQAITGVPVFVGATIYTNIGLVAGAQTAQNTKFNCLDGIGWLLAKILVAYITQSMVQWINSGFKGSPTFVQDPQGFFLNIANQQALNVFTNIFPATAGVANALCSPFSAHIALNLAAEFSLPDLRLGIPGGGGYDFGGCSLTTVGNNVVNGINNSTFNASFNAGIDRTSSAAAYNDYTDDDFSDGGWGSWFNITQDSRNNQYGAQIDAENLIDNSVAASVNVQANILDWGNGFHSITGTLQNGIDEILTPGVEIQQTLHDSLGNGVDELNIANSIDDIVGALMGQLLNQVANNGVVGLSQSQPNSPTPESYLQQINDETTNTANTAPTVSGVQSGNPPPQTGPTQNPTLRNIALDEITQESSVYNGYIAANAVDGHTSQGGAYGQDAITNPEVQPWWQVDLGSSQDLSIVYVWPRTQDIATLLNDFYVLVSDTPFPAGVPLAQLLTDPNIQSFYFTGSVTNPPAVIPVNTPGQYVRIQMADPSAQYLELTQVQVFATSTPVTTP